METTQHEKLKVRNLFTRYFYKPLSSTSMLHFLCMYSTCDHRTRVYYLCTFYFFKGFCWRKKNHWWIKKSGVFDVHEKPALYWYNGKNCSWTLHPWKSITTLPEAVLLLGLTRAVAQARCCQIQTPGMIFNCTAANALDIGKIRYVQQVISL